MKKLLPLIFCILVFQTLNAQVNFTDSNLPIVVINTNTQTIIDTAKITCDMGIISNGIGMRNYTTDPFNNFIGFIGIEIRGSTSQQYPKKSYGFETRTPAGLALNVPLLGMPAENDWILYGAYPDKSLMRNEITYHLFSLMDAYSPRFVYCELVIDGQYMGVYSLMERIKIDHNRVNIAKLDSNDLAGDSLTGGYIIKIDKPTGSSALSWTSPYQFNVKYLYHDPQDNELNPIQAQYIQDYVTAFEDTVYGPNFSDTAGGFRRYINTGTFIDFFLMEELGRTVDGYRSSSFMYKDKDSKGGKLSCGPMWDFNLSYGNADYCAAYDTTGWQYNFESICPGFTLEPPAWWPRLLQDTLYTRELKCRWNYLRQTILSTTSINSWIDSVALHLNESQQRNFTEWPILGQYVNWNYFVGNSYQEEIDYLKWWFQARSTWMDANLPGTCPMITVGNSELKTENSKLEIYPNPASTEIRLQFTSKEHFETTVYDLVGKPVLSTKDKNIINISELANGIYFLKTAQGTKLFTNKFIKQ